MTEKIGWGQVGLVLVLSRIFSEAANFPSDDINYGMQRFTVILLSYILLIITLIPLFIWSKKYGGISIYGKSRTAAIITVIYLITAGVTTSTRLQFYASSTIFDAAPPWFIVLSLTVVCLYGIFKGVSAVLRTGIITCAGFLLLLITVLIGVSDNIELKYLYPSFADDTSSLFGQVMSEYSKNAEAVVFGALLQDIRKKPEKSLYVFLPISFITLMLMTFLYNTVLGEYLNVTNFPFYTLAALSDISVLQRLDGLDVVIWIMAAVIRTSLFILSVYLIAQSAFRNKKTARIICFSALGIKAASALWFSTNTDDFLVYARFMGTGIPLLIAAFVVPLTVLAVTLSKEKGGKRLEAD